MSTLTSTLTVRLIDGVSAPARSAAASIGGIGSAVDGVNGRRLAISGALSSMTRDKGLEKDGVHSAELRQNEKPKWANFTLLKEPGTIAARFRPNLGQNPEAAR